MATSGSDYMHSAERKAMRGTLEFAVRRYQGRVFMPILCALCDQPCTHGFHLHELVARGSFGNKEALFHLPPQLHALLCPACNMECADSDSSRAGLVQYNCLMWTKSVVRYAVNKFNTKLVELGSPPMAPHLFPYYLLGGE